MSQGIDIAVVSSCDDVDDGVRVSVGDLANVGVDDGVRGVLELREQLVESRVEVWTRLEGARSSAYRRLPFELPQVGLLGIVVVVEVRVGSEESH